MPTTGKGTWTVNDNDDFDLPIDLAAMANTIDGWTTSRYERRGTSVSALGSGDYIGQTALISPYTNTYNEYYWDGSRWVAVSICGQITGITVAASGTNTRTLTFPTNAFVAWPLLLLTPMGANARSLTATIDSIDQNQAVVRLHNGTNSERSCNLHWYAHTRSTLG